MNVQTQNNLKPINITDILSEYPIEKLTELGSDLAIYHGFVYDITHSTDSSIRQTSKYLLNLRCEILSKRYYPLNETIIVFLENGEWGIALENDLGLQDLIAALFLYENYKNTNTIIKFDMGATVKLKYLEIGFLARTDLLVEDMMIYGGDIRQIQLKYALPSSLFDYRLKLLKK